MLKRFSMRARSLGIALCFAASVGSLSIAPVMAQDNTPDLGDAASLQSSQPTVAKLSQRLVVFLVPPKEIAAK